MTAPHISTLAARQKRLRDWTESLETIVQDNSLRASIKRSLESYRTLITQIWERNAITEGDIAALDEVERQLEKFNEAARQTVIPRTALKDRRKHEL